MIKLEDEPGTTIDHGKTVLADLYCRKGHWEWSEACKTCSQRSTRLYRTRLDNKQTYKWEKENPIQPLYMSRDKES